MKKGYRKLVWFSCGAASACAAKLAVESGELGVEVLYCNTLATEHPDNARFFKDVERWIGRKIVVLSSEKYKSVDEVFEKRRYMAGPSGALCTTEMKKFPRIAYQRDTDTHVFGYTVEEQKRADRFESNNPELHVEWLLIDRGVTKQDCQDMLRNAGIAQPEMYKLGFDHNNCIGCPKSTSSGYWNKVRRLFPEVFARRVRQSRTIGVRLISIGVGAASKVAGTAPQPMMRGGKVGGHRIFLDQLPPDENDPDDDIDCGPVCQTASTGGQP